MSESKSWENDCCRCGSDVKVNVHPGKRACHLTCGPCWYPDNPNCVSCEIVGHCTYALDYLKSLGGNGISKGFYFNEQLTGEENMYHVLQFVNAEQYLANRIGDKKYLENLKKTNSKSPCLTNSS